MRDHKISGPLGMPLAAARSFAPRWQPAIRAQFIPRYFQKIPVGWYPGISQEIMPPEQPSHQLHETRSPWMHHLVAERYAGTPKAVIQFGLANLKRWQQLGVECDDFRLWEVVLRDRPQFLSQLLCGSSEEAVRMRQSWPFAGLIPEDIRRQVLASPL